MMPSIQLMVEHVFCLLQHFLSFSSWYKDLRSKLVSFTFMTSDQAPVAEYQTRHLPESFPPMTNGSIFIAEDLLTELKNDIGVFSMVSGDPSSGCSAMCQVLASQSQFYHH
jgi:hypothetical protein